MKHYPPAHIIHEADCDVAPAGLFVFQASNLQNFPNGRPHACFSRATITHNRDVVAEPGDYEPHSYEPSTLRPADAAQPLCKVCRGTHGEEPFDLRAFLDLGASL